MHHSKAKYNKGGQEVSQKKESTEPHTQALQSFEIKIKDNPLNGVHADIQKEAREKKILLKQVNRIEKL